MNSLDTCIYIHENRQLRTTLYTKPTDTHNYLHYKSSHPKHRKNSLPYLQALRLRTICTNERELTIHCEKNGKKFHPPWFSQENTP